ncbi:hypothetical protein SAMN05216241_10357 [Limimonas halophila]|uniref:Uncharacterized protein n=1 Tax=Limimonas halophila TaxID=1082479 RepID=A0A1G7PSZ2_9PROT|nr:hypothetical protein [Limimonas halophila]SDF89351.1 hypothetical protein SAMN05216241_10357 [Limimonas halophila]
MIADSRTLADHMELGFGRREWAAPVWTVLRRHGEALHAGWVAPGPVRTQLATVLALPAAREATTLELAAPRAWEAFDPGAGDAFPHRDRGLFTYGFRVGEQQVLVPPTQTIATNRPPAKVLDSLLESQELAPKTDRHRAGGAKADADQALLRLDGATDPPVQPLFRGNRVVGLDSVTGDEAAAMLDRMLAWVHANVAGDGALPYTYWPSRGEWSSGDNVIRQLLATLGLIRAGRVPGRAATAELARANLARNLRAYLVDCGDHAAMECTGKGKLGATALAALAILEQEGTHGPHADAFAKLRAGVDRQWREDGGFQTFLWPAERNDCQNFYPGEALLFYAALHRHTGEPAVLERALRSFRCYRAWHRRHPNPAFVPWHAQACAALYHATGDDELRAFVVEMTDWLVTLQQWGAPLAPDLWGRFHVPGRPDYGPPHAASTGVYLEGLATAYALARDTGDTARAQTYRLAIRRGLRSLRQLQFVSEVDTFYISKPARVLGALRTEAYDNTVRLDNLGHALLALTNLPSWDTAEP